MSSIEIRPIRPADAPAARALLLDLGHDNDVKSLSWRISAIEGTPRERVMVATIDGIVVALAAASAFRYFHVEGLVCRVTALVVSQDHRRHGIGKRLMIWAEAWALEQGCDRVEVTARKERGESLKFLLENGYEDTSRRFFKHLAGGGQKGEL